MTPAIAVPQAKDRPELETEISDGVVGNKRFEEGALDRVSLSEKLTTVPAASATVVGHVRSREMIELRLELAKHLTLVYVDGGQHPQEATNIMRLVEELEAKVKLETEVCRGIFCCRLQFFGGIVRKSLEYNRSPCEFYQ